MSAVLDRGEARVLGRYVVFDEIAAGGMASVHVARHLGPLGFCRTVAIKRLHPQFARDPDFVAMFVDEARLAARVQHPNVVSMLDIVTAADELFLVMDYVHGETLSRLVRRAAGEERPIAPALASAVLSDALYGLHAAHEARDERDQPLRIVHRDVSPQNLLVGADGVTRMLDFGVAKASTRSQVTRDGELKGKLAYMAPEQIRARPIDRRADVFAAAVVLWELVTGRRLFEHDDPGAVVHHILNEPRVAPSEYVELPPELDEVILCGLQHRPEDRFATARAMAVALEGACTPASDAEVGAWVDWLAGAALAERRERIALVEALPPARVEEHITRVGSEIRSLLRDMMARDAAADAPTVDESVLDPAIGARPADTDAHVSEVAAAPVERSSRSVLFAALAAAGLVAAVVFVLSGREDPAATVPANVPAPDTVPVPAALPTADTAATTTPEPASAEKSPAPPASASSPPSATAARRLPPRTNDCTPPFYFEDGIERYKPHCFAR